MSKFSLRPYLSILKISSCTWGSLRRSSSGTKTAMNGGLASILGCCHSGALQAARKTDIFLARRKSCHCSCMDLIIALLLLSLSLRRRRIFGSKCIGMLVSRGSSMSAGTVPILVASRPSSAADGSRSAAESWRRSLLVWFSSSKDSPSLVMSVVDDRCDTGGRVDGVAVTVLIISDFALVSPFLTIGGKCDNGGRQGAAVEVHISSSLEATTTSNVIRRTLLSTLVDSSRHVHLTFSCEWPHVSNVLLTCDIRNFHMCLSHDPSMLLPRFRDAISGLFTLLIRRSLAVSD